MRINITIYFLKLLLTQTLVLIVLNVLEQLLFRSEFVAKVIIVQNWSSKVFVLKTLKLVLIYNLIGGHYGWLNKRMRPIIRVKLLIFNSQSCSSLRFVPICRCFQITFYRLLVIGSRNWLGFGDIKASISCPLFILFVNRRPVVCLLVILLLIIRLWHFVDIVKVQSYLTALVL